MRADYAKQLKNLRDGIAIDAPLVADFFETSTPLAEYASALHSYRAAPAHSERQKLFKLAVRKKLAAVFDAHELKRGNINWDADWKINIVDHHGLLNHPILIATNIISTIHQVPSLHPEGIVVLSDSGIPMNNFFHKRGVKFQNKQINIHPDRDRHKIAYAMPIKKIFPFSQSAEKYVFSPAQRIFLKSLEYECERTSRDSRIHNYVSQIQRINYTLWKKLFSEELRDAIPDLFYVAHEEVAVEMLKCYLLDDHHIFTRLLCDPETRLLFLKAFDGITGCWDSAGNTGSHFFWFLSERGEAVSLIEDDNRLISSPSTNQRWSMQRHPDEIISVLESRKIFPTMFLVYGIAIFHCGIRPLVGYGSMNYQTKMKEAWIRVLRSTDPAEADLVGGIPTNGFIGGPKVTFQEVGGRFEDLFALDILYLGGIRKKYLDHLRNMPFNELLKPALIDIYSSYVKPENKQQITITSDDLMGGSFSWIRTAWT